MARSTEEVFNDWLVMASQAGDAGAFEALAARWQRRLVALAFRRIGQPEGAAEAAQEAWLAIIRALPTLDDPARFPGWAARIADRKAVDWARRRKRRRALDDRIAADPGLRNHAMSADPIETDAEEADRQVVVERLRERLRALPADQRALLSLFYTDGRSIREIAELLGAPEGTIKSRLFLARKRLKSELER